MTESYIYHIAGLRLEIRAPGNLEMRSVLPSFSPFVEGAAEQIADCMIELVNRSTAPRMESERLLSDVSEVWSDRFQFFETDNGYRTTINGEENKDMWIMDSNQDFSRSVIYFSDSVPTSVLSWLTMMVFGQACLLHKVILIHASAVSLQGKAYAFLGKSGTGKSTHSRLWLENISGTELINDDNPAIRLEADGSVYLYGTPWSGKIACYKNVKVQLEAFIRLKQATYNRMSPRSDLAAFISVMPSCTAIRWNRYLFREMNNTLEDIVQRVKVAELECLPNVEAARHCYQYMRIMNINTNSNTK